MRGRVVLVDLLECTFIMKRLMLFEDSRAGVRVVALQSRFLQSTWV